MTATLHALVPSEGTESSVRQATLLARLLAETMIANVQNTAALNLSAADTLLAHARIPKPAGFEHRGDEWRMAWRSFEICATTADRLLGLTRGHVERTTSGLWTMVERLFTDMAHLQTTQIDALRQAFVTLHEAQETYLHATRRAHESVIALARLPPPKAIDAH
jgi:hypothetical protein